MLKQKNKFLIVFALIFLLTIVIFSYKSFKLSKYKNINKSIGVIVTTELKYKTKIYWFDENLNQTGSSKLNYAGLGSHFYSPVYYEGEIYIIPVGLGKSKNTKKVISINQNSLKITEYPFEGRWILRTAVIDDIVYCTNTKNGTGWVEAYNKKTKNKKDLYIEKSYIDNLIPCNNNLLVSSQTITKNRADRKSILNLVDKELNILKQIDISTYGKANNKYYIDNDYIYTTISLKANDEFSFKVLKISKKDLSIEAFSDIGYMPNDIYKYKDKFIVTNYDRVTNEGKTINVFDENFRLLYSKTIDTYLTNTSIYKNKFIVANREKIQIYDIDTFDLLCEKVLNVKRGWYTSAIITR